MRVEQPGAAALMLCDLASGRLDVLYDQHLKPWDSIAGLLLLMRLARLLVTILPQTGGRFTDPFASDQKSLRSMKLWSEAINIPLLAGASVETDW